MKMKTSALIATICIVMTLSATVSLSLEEYINYKTSESVRHHIVKRKGGGRGGSGRGIGRSRSSSSHKSHKQPSNPYPKQPSNPYPKQPPYNPNYPNQQMPHNTGHNTGHGQQMGYPSQTGYNQNYGQASKTGGLLGGAAGAGTGLGHKSKTGILGSGLGGAAVGGVAGAALGAYGGYKLGKMVGKMGRYGHYGYYDNDHRYHRCEPPPRIEYDPIANTSYIPRDVHYDNRCEYYDHDPSRSYGYQNYRYGINAQNMCNANHFWLIIGFIVNAFWIIGKLQLYFT